MMLLVVGAQKSGTSTLHHALSRFDDLDVLEKELGLFDPATDNVLDTDAVLASQDPDRVAVEVATRYTMRPEVDGVLERASRKIDPATTFVAYVVREPVARITSHANHEQLLGRIGADRDAAVRCEARFIDNTRYAAQIEPWLDFVGQSRVSVISFEDLAARPAHVCAELRSFCGLPRSTSTILEGEVIWENRTLSNPRLGRYLGGLLDSQFYRRSVRPLLPTGAGRAISRRIPAAPAPHQERALLPSTREWIRETLRGDKEQLTALFPRTASWWPQQPPAGAVTA